MVVANRQVTVPGVASILRSLVGARNTTTNAVDQVLRPTQPKLKGQGLAGQGVSANRAEPAHDSQRAKNGVDVLVAALGNTAQQQAESQQAQQQQAFDPRQVTIEAEPRLNAVIVRDAPERLPRYEQLIAALDVEPQSLEIEATIIDVNTDKARELGINWRWNNDGREASFSGAVPLDRHRRRRLGGARLGRPVLRPHPCAADRRRGACRVEPAGGHAVERRGGVRQQLDVLRPRRRPRARWICSTSAPARRCASRRMCSATRERRPHQADGQRGGRQPHRSPGRPDPGGRALDHQHAGADRRRREPADRRHGAREQYANGVDKVPRPRRRAGGRQPVQDQDQPAARASSACS